MVISYLLHRRYLAYMSQENRKVVPCIKLRTSEWIHAIRIMCMWMHVHLGNLQTVHHQASHRISVRWRHNGRDSVSNYQPHDCLLNHLFRRRSKKTSKLRVTGLCAGSSPGTGEFPAQMASYAENVSSWWRHHGWENINWQHDENAA